MALNARIAHISRIMPLIFSASCSLWLSYFILSGISWGNVLNCRGGVLKLAAGVLKSRGSALIS
jgi:hypothetical protein